MAQSTIPQTPTDMVTEQTNTATENPKYPAASRKSTCAYMETEIKNNTISMNSRLGAIRKKSSSNTDEFKETSETSISSCQRSSCFISVFIALQNILPNIAPNIKKRDSQTFRLSLLFPNRRPMAQHHIFFITICMHTVSYSASFQNELTNSLSLCVRQNRGNGLGICQFAGIDQLQQVFHFPDFHINALVCI